MWKDGLCDRSYLTGPGKELEEAYTRYKIFLELAAGPAKGRIVPTSDVDLIWHTHQLDGLSYRCDLNSPCVISKSYNISEKT